MHLHMTASRLLGTWLGTTQMCLQPEYWREHAARSPERWSTTTHPKQSSTSVCKGQIALRDDPCHNESPHAVLLTEIAKLLLHRLQLNLHTAMIKVKSHTGVQGNEMADQLANAARQPDHCQLSIFLGNHAFNNQMWPQILKRSSNPQAGGQLAWHTANNLYSCLRTHVASKHAKGLTTPGQYHSFWSVVRPALHSSSFSFWRSNGVPFRNKVNLLEARWGQLWNKNIARRQKMSYKPGQARAKLMQPAPYVVNMTASRICWATVAIP